MTHKQAILILKRVILGFETENFPKISIGEVIELLENEMWHKYPDEKPKENKSYLIKYESGEYRVLEYINNNWEVFNDSYKDKIVAWREIPEYESEVKNDNR